MLKKGPMDSEKGGEWTQSNPRKQEVIPATDFEYFQYFVMLKKVASSEDKMKINSELLLSCKLIF